jgi:DNA-binding protein HU-beta
VQGEHKEKSMNKGQFIDKMHEKSGLTLKDAEKAYKAFTDTVIEALRDGEKVQLVGFGTFDIGERSAREGRNPQTGESIQIAASKSPKFKAGKAFKDAINE